MTPERALHNLQAAAYSLRHQLDSKVAVRYNAGMYQLNPQMQLAADVRDFDDGLSRARGATQDSPGRERRRRETVGSRERLPSVSLSSRPSPEAAAAFSLAALLAPSSGAAPVEG